VNHIDDITWQPGFNDPEPLGWIGFAAYGVASVLCFRAALWSSEARPDRQSKRAWLLFGLALALLGINLQLDLHALFFQWVRQVAEFEGWYEKRRAMQRTFIVTFAAVSFSGAILIARHFHAFVKTQRLAVFGALLIVGYALLRGASFNHIDDREQSLLEMKDQLRLVELTGVAAIGFAAWRYPRSSAGRQTTAPS